jgi:hypothetical protein
MRNGPENQSQQEKTYEKKEKKKRKRENNNIAISYDCVQMRCFNQLRHSGYQRRVNRSLMAKKNWVFFKKKKKKKMFAGLKIR